MDKSKKDASLRRERIHNHMNDEIDLSLLWKKIKGVKKQDIFLFLKRNKYKIVILSIIVLLVFALLSRVFHGLFT